MDKTDKPKSVREVLDKLVSRTAFDVKGVRDWDKLFAQALADIYTLLGEGVRDKDNICEFDLRIDIGENNKAERRGFNQANALWRKHLQERLK